MTAESNLAAGGTGGKGLNIGILFMLSLPYLIIGSVGFVWWRKNRKADLNL
jgi:LPXTG-motif cell wall-anchored protein